MSLLCCAAAAALVWTSTGAGWSPPVEAAAVPMAPPPYSCPAETFPPTGSPRSASPVPYAVPFSGTITDGVLTVGPIGALKAVLGPADADVCGVLDVATLGSTIAPDQFMVTNNPVPVSVDIMGLQIFEAYVDLRGTASVQIEDRPAANGGLNIDLTAGFSATLEPSADIADLLSSHGLQVPVSGTECTSLAGPIEFTTGRSGALTGRPVTGPISGGQATVVANDFVFPAIDPSTPPGPSAPSGGYCAPQVASLFNTSLLLPAAPGNASFTASATFAVHATQ